MERKMRAKWFWLYSDGKKVKEISWEQWRNIVTQDRGRENTRLVCRADTSELYLRKGDRSVSVPLAQLKKVLDEVNTKNE